LQVSLKRSFLLTNLALFVLKFNLLSKFILIRGEQLLSDKKLRFFTVVQNDNYLAECMKEGGLLAALPPASPPL